MKGVGEVLKLSKEYLEKRGFASPRREAEELLADVLDLKRLDLYMRFDQPLNDEEMEQCREWLKRRSEGEPQAYIRGNVEFYGCTINVSPAVLIPRPETEILADHIFQSINSSQGTLWDLCTGSGCLGIALKKALPKWEIALSDISSEALKVAQENSEKNGVSVEVLQGDLWEPFAGRKADLIVCNPPYISTQEYEQLDPQVKNFEPRKALLADDNGLVFYHRIAKGLKEYLNPGGQLWLELGYTQGPSVQEIFLLEGYSQGKIIKDLAGHDRFFSLSISA